MNHPCFTFTEREQFYDQVSHPRLMAILALVAVDIHEVDLASNSLGEYLFITASCRTQLSAPPLTFWGMGYHEYRERWIMDSWEWYESVRKRTELEVLPKEEALQQILDREQFVTSAASSTPLPSYRAQLYALLADLTDEDGALNELDDLDWTFLDSDSLDPDV